jgi:hypothetical protein
MGDFTMKVRDLIPGIREVLNEVAPPGFDEQELDRHAHNIALSHVMEKAGLAAVSRNGTRQGDIDKVRRKISSLAKALENLEADGILALSAKGEPSGEELLEALSQMDKQLVSIRGRLHPPPKKGRPLDILAARTTEYAKYVYQRITGKVAVRSIDRSKGKPTGPFFRFVKRLFGVLSIKAKVDNQIRTLIEKKS